MAEAGFSEAGSVELELVLTGQKAQSQLEAFQKSVAKGCQQRDPFAEYQTSTAVDAAKKLKAELSTLRGFGAGASAKGFVGLGVTLRSVERR